MNSDSTVKLFELWILWNNSTMLEFRNWLSEASAAYYSASILELWIFEKMVVEILISTEAWNLV